MLDDVMLYWLPRTGASSARLYRESIAQVNEWISGTATDTVTVPTGCSIFPKELQRPSRRWAQRRFLDIRHWGQPELFVDEVRAFFAHVR
jgi:epoxide hydrolase